MQVGEAFVTVRPDVANFGPELERGVVAPGRQAAASLASVFGAVAIGAGIRQVIGDASDLQQAIGGTSAVFQESSGQIDAWAANSVEAVGLSEAAYRQLTSVIGAQLRGAGLSFEEAATQANALTETGADLAATFGGTTQDAVSALGAAFRGEFDTAERFGISLTAVRVAAEAVRLGLAESTGAVSQQARAYAVLSLIQQSTADSAGQFAREADTAAGAQQRATAAAENASAAFGDQILPIYAQLVGVVGQLASAFGALPGPIQSAAIGLAALSAIRMSGTFTGIGAALSGLRARFAEAGGGAAGFRAAITPGALGTVAAVAALALVTNELSRQAEEAAHTRTAIASLTEALAEGGNRGLAESLLGQSRDDFPIILDVLTEAEIGIRSVVDAYTAGGSEAEAMSERISSAMVDAGYGFLVAGGHVDDFRNRITEAAGGLGDLEAENAGVESSASGAAASLDDQVASMQAIADAADQALDKLEALFGINQSLAEGAIDLREGARELTEQLGELGQGGYQAGTESGDAFLSSLQDQSAAMREQVAHIAASTGSFQQASQAQDFLAQSIRNVAVAAGVPRAAIDALLRDFGLIPDEILTELTADGGGARAELQRTLAAMTPFERRQFRAFLSADGKQARTETANVARNALSVWDGTRYAAALDADAAGVQTALQQAIGYGNDWEGRVFQARLEAQFTASGVAGQAAGGPYRAGRAHLVGEQGPELRVEDHDGFTFTAAQTRDLMRGGGAVPAGGGGGGDGNTLVVNVNIGTLISDTAEAAKQLAPDIAREITAFQESW